METIIRIKNLSHIYSPSTPFEQVALDDINLDIRKGEILGIIGHTGSGKSTFIQHLNGLLKPSSGEILYDGENIHKSKDFTRFVRFNVGLVFQYPEYQLFEETVYRDIAFGPTNMKLSEAEIKERVIEACLMVGLDLSLLDKSPFELSGGQKRRVAIAGVIAMRPRVLILDEPTAGLDPRGRDDILTHMKAYNNETGATVIFVTHSMEDIAMTVDRLIVMEKGKLLMTGTPGEIFTKADELTRAGLTVPQVTQVMTKLKEAGLPIRSGIYTIDDALNELLPFVKGGVSRA